MGTSTSKTIQVRRRKEIYFHRQKKRSYFIWFTFRSLIYVILKYLIPIFFKNDRHTCLPTVCYILVNHTFLSFRLWKNTKGTNGPFLVLFSLFGLYWCDYLCEDVPRTPKEMGSLVYTSTGVSEGKGPPPVPEGHLPLLGPPPVPEGHLPPLRSSPL